MQLNICNDYAEMSSLAAEQLIRKMSSRSNPLLCPASGSTPIGLYKKVAELYEAAHLDPAGWMYISLDEWVGMNGSDPGSCRHFINQHLFSPLRVQEEQFFFFDGRSNDLQKECRAADGFIERYGPLTVAIVGIGMNGHIGFNEPGTSPALKSHVVNLDHITKDVGKKYFEDQPLLERGITLGFQTLLQSDTIILLASGRAKAEVVDRFYRQPADPSFPATILKQHKDLHVYLDNELASLLTCNAEF